MKDRFAKKWEKWKSSTPRIRQMNYGKGKRMSWIRKMRENSRLLMFLAPGNHLSHVAEESLREARFFSGEERVKILSEIS